MEETPRREQISKNLLVPEDGLLDVACKDDTLMGGGGRESDTESRYRTVAVIEIEVPMAVPSHSRYVGSSALIGPESDLSSILPSIVSPALGMANAHQCQSGCPE